MDDAGALTADDLGRTGEAELVGAAGADEFREDARSALADDAFEAPFPQCGEREREVDGVGSGDDHLGDLSGLRPRLGGRGLARDDDRSRPFRGVDEERGGEVEGEAVGDDGDGRGRAPALPEPAPAEVVLGRTVLLGAGGACSDEDDVGKRTVEREDRAVDGVAEPAGAPGDGRGAVDRGDEDRADPRLRVGG